MSEAARCLQNGGFVLDDRSHHTDITNRGFSTFERYRASPE